MLKLSEWEKVCWCSWCARNLTYDCIWNYYTVIDSDIRAAREKNGVYIPRERFAQEEAEKKVASFYLFLPPTFKHMHFLKLFFLLPK